MKLGTIGNVVKEKLGKLVMLIRRFGLFLQNVDPNRKNDNEDKLRPPIAWPHVMNSHVPMLGPIVQGSWIWHHHHRRCQHGYYRTRR